MGAGLTSFALKDQSINLTTRTFGPQNMVRIKKPNLVWEAWPEGDNSVTKVSVSLDGKKSAVKYDRKLRRVFMPLDAPLKVGPHKVEMEIFVNNWAKFKKDWTFEISQDAFDELPLPDDSARQILASANAKRTEAGLEPYILDSRLCIATKLHADYMKENRVADHTQQLGRPFFTAVTPQERMQQFGFSEAGWEVLANEVEDIDVGIARLFDAPYHRISFLQPGELPIGGCLVQKFLVIDGQMSSENRVVVSPKENQKDVPILWNDRESPDPLRNHPLKGSIGYPIVFSYFSDQGLAVKLLSVSVKKKGTDAIKVFVNHPGNDEFLTNSIMILPETKFEEQTVYSVEVKAQDARGKDISKTWSFTTQ